MPHGLRKVLLVMLLMLPVLLMLLPVDFFDRGRSICIYTNITGKNCYGCGMTRALMHILHFDFTAAWAYNKLAFAVFPLIALFYLKWVFALLGVRILKWFR